MAKRPIFVPQTRAQSLVKEVYFNILWHSGFAPSQKKRNISNLHTVAAKVGYSPILETSTKSEEALGQRLSAFHLKVESDDYGVVPLECAYQGGKAFERGGPYLDLYYSEPRAAKRDTRLQNSGKLLHFEYAGVKFPLEPKHAFYDWLYITSLMPHREWLQGRLDRFAAFTDIEFNPGKSINCQARSCALFVALMRSELLDDAVRSPEDFINLMKRRPVSIIEDGVGTDAKELLLPV